MRQYKLDVLSAENAASILLALDETLDFYDAEPQDSKLDDPTDSPGVAGNGRGLRGFPATSGARDSSFISDKQMEGQ